METSSIATGDAFKFDALYAATVDAQRKKLELKLNTTRTENLCTYDPPSPCYSNPTDSEPPSPDSGFSSDENVSPLSRRETRNHTLPSALRRSRSKACAKRVRFADALGLDLEKRQYFTEKESNLFPTPPSSPTPGHRLVLSNFAYCSESEYNERARDQMVCLSKLRVHGHTINGQVNVANIAFSKEVAIRYTTTNWATHDEVAATYGHNVFGADNVDAFVFSMMLPADIKGGQCQFCVRFTVNGSEFWDNNSGNNYCVDVVPDNSSPPSSDGFPVSKANAVAGTCTFFTPRRLRRWGRAQEESDDESSRVYIPRRRIAL
ncbi:CBM21 domain-containing protein [Trichostrongylus colubriformis]|uniref:CBM21 domain-containing protein n=1 Tax=Trichostrongylus colubriformis TaxID=6319 RepID=A0AAN8EVF5_TRICO